MNREFHVLGTRVNAEQFPCLRAADFRANTNPVSMHQQVEYFDFHVRKRGRNVMEYLNHLTGSVSGAAGLRNVLPVGGDDLRQQLDAFLLERSIEAFNRFTSRHFVGT